MARGVRHMAVMAWDFLFYAMRTGRWWVPAVTFVLALAVLLMAVIKVATPTAVYVLF